MAVPSKQFDGQKVINAILYGDNSPAPPIGLAAFYSFASAKPPTPWSETRYRLREAAGYMRLALSVLTRG